MRIFFFTRLSAIISAHQQHVTNMLVSSEQCCHWPNWGQSCQHQIATFTTSAFHAKV